MKKFNFAMTDNTVYTGKDLTDFYSKALLEGRTRYGFKVVPGIKSTAKLPRWDAGNLLQTDTCKPSATGEGTLSQKSVEVCPFVIKNEFCVQTFENDFLGEYLANGSMTGEIMPMMFQDYVVNQIQAKVQNDLELITWQGDSESLVYPFSACDGLLKKLGEDSAVIDATPAATITAANVIAEIKKVYDLIPVTVIAKEDLTIYASDYIVRLYQSAIAAQSNEAYYVGAKENNFLGIKIVRAEGMAAGSMVAAQASNLLLLTDLLSDEESLRILPQGDVNGDETVIFNARFKFGVDYAVSEEIVLYAGDIA